MKIFLILALIPMVRFVINTKLISGLVVISLIVFAAFLWFEAKLFNQECVSSVEEKIVRGNSLTGLIESGETVKILFGYYDCNEIQKEDIIVYYYAGNEVPLIKIVKGIPGDKFSFQETESGWHILINKEILKNSESQPYILDEKGYKILSLYEKDYEGIIPKDAYLIMGNLISGATDSTRYGLVYKTDILGRTIRSTE